MEDSKASEAGMIFHPCTVAASLLACDSIRDTQHFPHKPSNIREVNFSIKKAHDLGYFPSKQWIKSIVNPIPLSLISL